MFSLFHAICMLARKSFLNFYTQDLKAHLNEQLSKEHIMPFPIFLPLHTKCPNPEKVPLRQLHTTHHHPSSPLTLEFSRPCSAIHFPY